MHFEHLGDAFRKLVLIEEEAFRSGLKEKPWQGKQIKEAEIFSGKDRALEMAAGS